MNGDCEYEEEADDAPHDELMYWSHTMLDANESGSIQQIIARQ